MELQTYECEDVVEHLHWQSLNPLRKGGAIRNGRMLSFGEADEVESMPSYMVELVLEKRMNAREASVKFVRFANENSPCCSTLTRIYSPGEILGTQPSLNHSSHRIYTILAPTHEPGESAAGCELRIFPGSPTPIRSPSTFISDEQRPLRRQTFADAPP